MPDHALLARRAALGLSLGALVSHSGSRTAHAQPAGTSRPARIIVPAGPAGAVDLSARLLAEGLARQRGHPLVVDNRPGADGILAAEAFARARPGEALFYSQLGIVTVLPLAGERLPYDPDIDFVPVHAGVTDFLGLAVPAASPARSVAEFADHARARPGRLNWHAPSGTAAYLVCRDFMRIAGGLDMNYVSYSRLPQALLDLVAGRLDVALSPLAPIAPLLRDGQLRLLATTGQTRAPAVPDVPTAAEAGFPSLEIEGILGLFGWRGMPETARAELAEQARAALTEPAAAERLRAAGMAARDASSPAAFTAELVAHRARWTALAREFGLRPAN